MQIRKTANMLFAIEEKATQLGAGINKVKLTFNGARGQNKVNFRLKGQGVVQGRIQTTLTFFKIRQQ